MRFMNDHDLAYARRRFGAGRTPNRLALVMVVDQLRIWADENSDGWAHWPAPCKAAAKAIELVDSTTNAENDRQEAVDISDKEMGDAVRPITSFLSRQKVTPERRELILRAASI